MQEIVEMRNLNSKHFLKDINKNEIVMNASVGHIHYKDGNRFYDIDTTLERVSNGWLQTKSNYHALIPTYSNGRLIFNDRFNSNREISIIPICDKKLGRLLEYDDSWICKKVRYDNAFGNGIHLEYTVGNFLLKKEVVIDSLESIEPNKDIHFDFKLEFPDNSLMVNNKIYSYKDNFPVYKHKLIIGESNDDYSTFIKKPVIRDSNHSYESIRMDYFYQDRASYIRKYIPYNFLKEAVFPVRCDAEATYYSISGGDGSCRVWNQPNWPTARNLANSQDVDTNVIEGRSADAGGGTAISIRRSHIPFDTATLPDDAAISAAILSLYVYAKNDGDNDGDDYEAIVESTQAAPTSLATSHYNDFTTIEGSDQHDITGIATSAYLAFTLDATGRGWINKTGNSKFGIREGHDILNNVIANASTNDIQAYSSERAGTSEDPKIVITYTTPGVALAPQGWANLADKYLSGNLM